MRNCLFVVLLAGLISACTSSGKPDNIVVTFDVKNPTATEVVLVYHRTINSVPLNEPERTENIFGKRRSCTHYF